MPIERRLVFHTDPGHGWLQVELRDIKSLRLEHAITRHSYLRRKAGFAYLEEDCDAPTFLKAAKEQGWIIKIEERYVDRESPIRDFAQYHAEF